MSNQTPFLFTKTVVLLGFLSNVPQQFHMKKQSPMYRFHHRSLDGNEYVPDQFLYTDPKTGSLLQVERDEDYITARHGSGKTLQNYFDALRYGTLRRNYPNNSGVWMWRDFILPEFPQEAIISLNEGQTDPFEVPEWFGKEIGLKNLFIKMEGQSPSESFKDRGMPVAISDALRLQLEYPDLGIKGVSCASTGDTSAAAAIYAAYRRDKLSCVVLVPNQNISPAQMFQAMAHGARVIAINHKDGFDACMKLVQEFAAAHPELVLVNSKNDMRLVGQETIGLEIIQDFEWKAPDWISIPVGNGGNLSALMIGLLRAKEHGLIDRLPKIIAAQSEKADTLVRWQESNYGDYAPGVFSPTVASAMNINDPVSFPRIKELLQYFDVTFIRVAEDELKETWANFMRIGANICPQTAVALDAVLCMRDRNLIKENDTVVAINTASGIKFAEAGVEFHLSNVSKFSNPYIVTEGNLAAVEAAYLM